MIKIFGIRHHGPGSSRSLLMALEEMQPDALLIEAPADTQDLAEHIAHEGLLPPVAILAYNPKELKQAAYFPFAEFSPEWQAIRWGLQRDKEIVFMDLPQGIHFTLDAEEAASPQGSLDMFLEEEPQRKADEAIIRDPLGYMGRLAGYPDGERWWEVTFEQREGEASTFEAVSELMAALRKELGRAEKPRTLLREAFMRKTLRKAAKQHGKVAVVCGAWHGPALEDLKQFKIKDDNQLLRGIKKTRIKATWVPWSHDRLARSSGYGAGVVSPAWYDMLFRNREEVVVRWMTQVAQLLRDEGFDTSSAHAIEAVRLAESLAALRQHPLPGMEELREAALTIFCHGNPKQMELISERLIVGDAIGEVPPEIPIIPLQKDLEKQIKSTRMTKYRKATGTQQRELDLRKESQRAASYLLHRLNILGIPWGEVKQQGSNRYNRGQGNFKEVWSLKWLPDFAIHIIEAGMWGNSVQQAATNLLIQKAKESEELPAVTRMLRQAIQSQLPRAIPVLVQKFQNLAALTQEVSQLLEAVPELVNALRYANTRQLDTDALRQQLDETLTRACIGLPQACMSLAEEAAAGMFKTVTQTDYQISVIEDEAHEESWVRALAKISQNASVHGLLRGAACRILYDRKRLDSEATGQRMRLNLSVGNDLSYSANWISGFLHGSGLVIIHDTSLWGILDEWVREMPPEGFQEVLPLLRRAFSRFSDAERKQMLSFARKGNKKTPEATFAATGVFPEKVNVPPVLGRLLGLE